MPSDGAVDYAARGRLDGRTFVVLGAGQGIGREVVRALSQSGAKVACVDLSGPRATEVAEEVGGIALVGDIMSRPELERIFREVDDRVGDIHGLVDIVGLNTAPVPLMQVDDDRWAEQSRIVLDHAFRAVQIGGRAIIKSGGGSIVLIGSIAGTVTTAPHHAAYGAAKAALHHLVAYAGKELAADGVRVNAVAPGVTLTPRSAAKFSPERADALARLVPAGRLATPDEIASAVLFLASDHASYVTGQTLPVDGGLSGTLRLDLP